MDKRERWEKQIQIARMLSTKAQEEASKRLFEDEMRQT